MRWKSMLTFLSLIIYVSLAYYTARHDTGWLSLQFFALFGLYFFLVFREKGSSLSFFLLAVLARLLIFFAVPNLSDDIFRFIWDGRLLAGGIHPFKYLPQEVINMPVLPNGINYDLYSLLNSKGYYTIYPPIPQFIFYLAALLFPEDVFNSTLIIRFFIVVADLSTAFFIYKILEKRNLNTKMDYVYLLNPLVILELTLNLHLEAVMLAFLFGSIYFLEKNNIKLSAVLFGLSVGAKLIPLIFLPYLFFRMPLRKGIAFILIVLGSGALLFLPLLSWELILGMKSSLNLYFQKFEFNAGLYYVVREAGFLTKGYNIIAQSGKWMAMLTFLTIVIYSAIAAKKKAPLMESFMWIYFFYAFFTLTFHPWYVLPLFAFSLFTHYRFPLVWTALIFLTYFGYTKDGYTENLFLIALEYTVVYGVLLFELFRRKPFNRKIAL